ncbi:dihydroorotase [Sphingomonas prati]|uniref:Dihydroorotase n=1 Tax=Sphingomonas prati TaxID=1843237 RepID=A0A7W9BPY9_9SPHN|nr:amidohydrolase family protein [Sphingomonas prati]MBB5727811.1 dihydroorotase [Sphingomonas prati]GGE80895.1 dihydroorotase [Sphingomonas prati]
MTILAILNGRVVDPATGSVSAGGVLIRDGRIAEVGMIDMPPGAETLDARGSLIAPGIVDIGCFAIDMPAFAAGGITRTALMPDQSPPIDDGALVQRALAAGKPALWVHPIAAATHGLNGTELAEIGLMAAAGAVAVATGRTRIADARVMHRVLGYAAALDLVTIVHAEDEAMVRGTVATDGETATRLGLPSAPAMSEAMAVARDLMLAEDTGAPIHFRQLTTAAAFDLVRAAKARGVPVTCGITPAHLYLSDAEIGPFRTFARLSPPLRCEADRQAARQAVADGTVDMLCSGHDPRGSEAKRLPFAESEPGMAGAETLLTLSLGLVRDGLITLPRLFHLLSTGPARRFNLPGGSMAPGAEADLILVDEHAPWRIRADAMAATAGNTPFDGLPVQGRVRTVIKGGRVL